MKKAFQIVSQIIAILVFSGAIAKAAGDVPFPLCQDGNPEHCALPASEAWMTNDGVFRVEFVRNESGIFVTLENLELGTVEVLQQVDGHNIWSSADHGSKVQLLQFRGCTLIALSTVKSGLVLLNKVEFYSPGN